MDVRYFAGAGAGAGAAGLVHLPSLQQGHLQSFPQVHFSPPLQGHLSHAALSQLAALSQQPAAWAGIAESTPKVNTNANSTVNNSVFFMIFFLSCGSHVLGSFLPGRTWLGQTAPFARSAGAARRHRFQQRQTQHITCAGCGPSGNASTGCTPAPASPGEEARSPAACTRDRPRIRRSWQGLAGITGGMFGEVRPQVHLSSLASP